MYLTILYSFHQLVTSHFRTPHTHTQSSLGNNIRRLEELEELDELIEKSSQV